MKALIRNTESTNSKKYRKGDIILIVDSDFDFSPKDIENNRVVELTSKHLEYDLEKEGNSFNYRGFKPKLRVSFKLNSNMSNRRKYYMDDDNQIRRR